MVVKTSAKASAASSWVGSMAIDGCMRSKEIRVPSRNRRSSRATAEGARACPAGPRQRLSSNLAIPSCNQMGVLFWLARVIR